MEYFGGHSYLMKHKITCTRYCFVSCSWQSADVGNRRNNLNYFLNHVVVYTLHRPIVQYYSEMSSIRWLPILSCHQIYCHMRYVTLKNVNVNFHIYHHTCRWYERSTESHDTHTTLTNVNIDVVLILCPLFAELHESFLGAQGGLELILHVAPGLVLRG